MGEGWAEDGAVEACAGAEAGEGCWWWWWWWWSTSIIMADDSWRSWLVSRMGGASL